MRYLTVALIVLGALAPGGPGFANDIYLRKHSLDEIKAACSTAGGEFSQDARGYGCGTDCHGKPGTACTVFCPNGEKCVAQVITGRRPRHVLEALKVPERHGR